MLRTNRLALAAALLAAITVGARAQENVQQEQAKREFAAARADAVAPVGEGEPLRPLMRDGKPFFPIGAFGLPKVYPAPLIDLDLLEPTGWNTVLIGANAGDLNKTVEFLDEMAEREIAVILNINHIIHHKVDGIWRLNPDSKDTMIRIVETVRDHPALLGYYTFDEPENYFYRYPEFQEIKERQRAAGIHPDLGAFMTEQAAWVKQTIKAHDDNPEHYVFATIAWWDHYDKLSEALVDVNMPNEYQTGVGGHEFGGNAEVIWHDARNAAVAAREYNGLGFVYTPFGTNNFGSLGSSWRAPTIREFRYSVFAPMTQGAMGCVYWAGYRCWEGYAVKVIFPVLRELHDLKDYFLLGEWLDEAAEVAPDWRIIHPRFDTPALDCCVRRGADGSVLVLVVNNLTQPVEAKLTLDAEVLGTLPAEAVEQITGDPVAIEGGVIAEPFEPLEVRAYRLEPAGG
jgi:hypothetical protein